MKCPKCDFNNPDDTIYCGKCAAPLKEEISASQTKTLQIPLEGLAEGSIFAERYEVIEELGSGGMGKVFLVLDSEIDEEVALKLLNPEIASDEKTIQRFRNELKFARKISHKNICRMYHLGKEKDTHYITMEYVPGEDLKSLIRRMGKLPEEKAVSVARQVCEGLTEAHRLAVVHRDLKPQNVMIDREGNARIMDFGISRSLETKGVTVAGMIIGTPDYMSPEQVEGKGADQRSDIYSLGVMLYEMATGKVPFGGDTALTIALKHKTEEPADPRVLNKQISEDLSGVILKCMEKDRENRYQSAKDLLLELRSIEEGMPIPSAPKRPQVPAFLTEGEEESEEVRPVFVARQQELDKLGKFFDLSLAEKGQVAFVTGGAGTGKTALVQEVTCRTQEAHADLIVASGKCNAQTGIGDPYLPFIEVMSLLTGDVETKWRAGFITREHATRLWNLFPIMAETLVEKGPDLIDTFVPGAELVSRALAYASGRAPWLTQLKKLVERKAAVPADSNLQQSVLFEKYTRVLEKLATEKPLLLVLDDLQWADAGSISLLFHLGRRIKGSRILIVGAYRPDDIALGRGGERHPLEGVVNELKRDFGDFEVELGKADGRPFIDAFLDAEPNRLDSKFRDTLFRQTQGYPLFTVELLRSMRDRGMMVKDDAGRWVEEPGLKWDALPARVDAVIEERISRLTESLKDLLTVASVEGEEFTAEVVARLKETDVLELVRLLSSELDKRHHLVSAKGIRRMDGQRLSLFIFQHILFQRYLYNSLNEVERAHIHEGVGTMLEILYGEHAEEIAVQLARHFQEAGITAKATEYLHKAGNKALRLSANEEAIAHFKKGLELLKTLPESPERIHQELELQIALGAPLMATKGPTAPEVEKAYTRARELCREVGETPQLFPVLRGLWEFYHVRAEFQTAHELGERLHSLAQSVQDPALLVEAHFALGFTLFFLGEFTPAREHVEQAIALYDPQEHRYLAFLYGSDPGVFCRGGAAYILWLIGYPDQAFKRIHGMLTLAQEIAHPFSQAIALFYAADHHWLRREGQLIKEHADAAIGLCNEHGFPYWLTAGACLKGWALVEQGQGDEGISQMHQGLAAYRAMKAQLAQSWFLALLAEAYGKVEKVDEGLSLLTEALAFVDKSGERLYEAELNRLKGELLLKKAEAEEKEKEKGMAKAEVKAEEEAEEFFHKAIEVASRQKAKSLELRAVMSLARLWQKQGKQEKARKWLTEIYNWFTEGFDTRDLKDAKALLKELS